MSELNQEGSKERPLDAGSANGNTDETDDRNETEAEGYAVVKDSEVGESAEILDLGDVSSLDGAGRNDLFERGKVYQQKGKRDLALQCFVGCIKGLGENSGFLYLPQCLRAIADTYYAMEEYTKAVQFIQAEKMYYETALVDTAELQEKIAETKTNEGAKISEGGDNSASDQPEALKAIEYENLARLCLDKEQPVLALEYSAKATKLRQQVYGEDHPITLKSLDLFTSMYAAVGKHQYIETLKKVGDKAYTLPDSDHPVPESGVRRRKAPPSSAAGDHAQTLEEEMRQQELADEERKRHIKRHCRDAEPYPLKFYFWLSPFFVIFAIACSVIVYDIYLIATEP